MATQALTYKDLIATLTAGQDLTFADPRFLLADEATIFLAVASDRKPTPINPNAPNEQSELGMSVLQIGSHSDPGEILDIRISLDLKFLLLSSSAMKNPVSMKLDSGGSRLMLFFSASQVRVFHIKSSLPEETFKFKFGDGTSMVTLPQLRLGGDGGKEPFTGILGDVMLFDKDIYAPFKASLAPKQKISDLLSTWLDGKPAQCFATWGMDALAPSLVGVAIPSQKRFDFNPREILWPSGRLGRWMMEFGDQQPIKVTMDNVEDQADHSIYTTNGVYCFTRMGGNPLLWGDGNQMFLLTYLGNNQFEGHSAAGTPIDQVITLTYKPDPANTSEPAFMDVTCVNWDNGQARLFQTRVIPPDATLSAAPTADVLYPADFSLKLMPERYVLSPHSTSNPDQKWSGAFAKVPFTITDSSKGWDISKIDDVLNPGASFSAGKGSQYYLFPMPASDSYDYRLDPQQLGTPVYCSPIDIGELAGTSHSKAFHSSREYSDSQGSGLGFGVGLGKESLLDCSFESTRKQAHALTVEHSLVINKSVGRSYAVVLERQWLELNSDFLVGNKGLKYCLEQITSAAVPAPRAQYAALFRLFDAWGTHYPNAITYGYAMYSMAFIDEAGAKQMTADSSQNKVAIGIPIDGLMTKANIDWNDEKSNNDDATVKSELHMNLETGAKDHAVPLKLDLRPIIELLQPPYMDENWALEKQMHLYAAMQQYYEDRKKVLPDGFALYEAKLVSIVNQNGGPIYLTARVFLAGLAPNTSIVNWPPAAKQNDEDLRVWYRDQLRIEHQSVYDVQSNDTFNPTQSGFAILSVPFAQTTFTPSICITGSVFQSNTEVVHSMIPEVPWNPVSDADVRAKEDQLAGDWHQPVGPLGVDWMTWTNHHGAHVEIANGGSMSGQVEWSTYDVNSHIAFPTLPDKGSTVTAKITINGIEFNFEVRKVDMVQCFSS